MLCNCDMNRGSEQKVTISVLHSIYVGVFCKDQGGAKKRNPPQIKANCAFKKP